MALLLYFHLLLQFLLLHSVPQEQEYAFYFDQPFTLQQSGSVTLWDTTSEVADRLLLSMDQIIDSRCPKDVRCIHAGSAELKMTFRSVTGESTAVTVAIGGNAYVKPESVQGDKFILAGKSYAVRVLTVAPYPIAEIIQPPKYARLLVVKL